MQAFLFSCRPGAGQRCPLTPCPIVVTCETFPSGRQVCWPLSAGRPNPPGAFRVVILYEDFATGLRARKACDFLAKELGTTSRFQPELCRCDVLEDPPLQRRVARAVARADLLVAQPPRACGNWLGAGA